MSRKADTTRTFNIAVVGLSGTEKEKGSVGVGKSCLCNRFIRPSADDYYPEHINVLSITDFSGRIVNNDHFLYWGYVTKCFEDAAEVGFHVVEQTEFIDDATFTAFKGGKMEPYIKRATATRLYSAEKLMYICKNQLGIEKEYEQKVMPEGRLAIDGFVVVFDVAAVPGRPLPSQLTHTTHLLNSILRTKKPYVLVTTKNDESSSLYVREIEKLIAARKDSKYSIPLIETSAHDNVNVDIPFLILSQIIDNLNNRKQIKVFTKVGSYAEMYRMRKEMLDGVSEGFRELMGGVVDPGGVWVGVKRDLGRYPQFGRYIELFGEDCAKAYYRRHLKKLKDDLILRKQRKHLDKLPFILNQLFPKLPDSQPWQNVVELIREHELFSNYFVLAPNNELIPEGDYGTWGSGSSSGGEGRVPFELLLGEAAAELWLNTLNTLHLSTLNSDLKIKFKLLLSNTPYVTPGKTLSELQVLFMGHDCYELLSQEELASIYNQHQIELISKAKSNFNELLLENQHLFWGGGVEGVKEDGRYRSLDRLDGERKLLLDKMSEFIVYGVGECPSGSCVDAEIEAAVGCCTTVVGASNGADHYASFYLIGRGELVEMVRGGLLPLLEDDDEYELDGIVYTTSIHTTTPTTYPPSTTTHLQARFILYDSMQCLANIKSELESNLLNNLSTEQYVEEPPFIVYYLDTGGGEKRDLVREGQMLAENLNCEWVQVAGVEGVSPLPLAESIQSLVRSLRTRFPVPQPQNQPDIRIILALFCGDNYNLERIIKPLFMLPNCLRVDKSTVQFQVFLGERRRVVQITFTSYHSASLYRNSLIHGLILLYSTSRLASFNTLRHFTQQISNLPILILAIDKCVVDSFNNSLGQKLITEGNSLADELKAHFVTLSEETNVVGIYSSFVRQCAEAKGDIERAFSLASPLPPNSPHVESEQIYESLSSDSAAELLPNSRFYTQQKPAAVGKLNIAEYKSITEVLDRMRMPSETLEKYRRPRGVVHPPKKSTSSETSDEEDAKPVRKKPVKSKPRQRRGAPVPIPRVPQGFVPYQPTKSGVEKQKEEQRADPITQSSDPLTTLTSGKKKKSKKLVKSRSEEQSAANSAARDLQFGTLAEITSTPTSILHKFIAYIESEGLDLEGLYRVPGNRLHVETLFNYLSEQRKQGRMDVDLKLLDIPVNAVATALKDFLTKYLPPSIPTERMGDVEKVSLIPDRSLKLLELKKFLRSLPAPNFKLLQLIFSHLVAVSEKSKINSMDSKNLSICWWPTLLPFSFADMFKFELMRPYLEDLIQNMIDQYPFLFCGQEDVVMV